MRRFLETILLLQLILVISNCNKESQSDDIVENDSINGSIIKDDSILLKYVDLIPDTTSFDINNDGLKDIMHYKKIHYLMGDTNYGVPVHYISSYDENISISYGRFPYEKENLLGIDSLIDNSLLWVNSYITYAPGPWFPDIDPDYIGIRLIENNDTFYGWIFKSSYYFEEYAIDTSTMTDNRNVYVGHRKKY